MHSGILGHVTVTVTAEANATPAAPKCKGGCRLLFQFPSNPLSSFRLPSQACEQGAKTLKVFASTSNGWPSLDRLLVQRNPLQFPLYWRRITSVSLRARGFCSALIDQCLRRLCGMSPNGRRQPVPFGSEHLGSQQLDILKVLDRRNVCSMQVRKLDWHMFTATC